MCADRTPFNRAARRTDTAVPRTATSPSRWKNTVRTPAPRSARSNPGRSRARAESYCRIAVPPRRSATCTGGAAADADEAQPKAATPVASNPANALRQAIKKRSHRRGYGLPKYNAPPHMREHTPETFEEKLQQLDERRAAALQGSEAAVEKHH